jgi:hypothetical protein
MNFFTYVAVLVLLAVSQVEAVESNNKKSLGKRATEGIKGVGQYIKAGFKGTLASINKRTNEKALGAAFGKIQFKL